MELARARSRGSLGQIPLEILCSSLSGGQWMRVRLAQVLQDQFLILDAPTNNLDREAREPLFQFLRAMTESFWRTAALLIGYAYRTRAEAWAGAITADVVSAAALSGTLWRSLATRE